MKRVLLLGVFLVVAALAQARGTYMEVPEFVAKAFPEGQPAEQALWLTAQSRPAVEEILGHPYPALRVPYWQQGTRSAWVLDEIGKEMPITIGVVVDAGRVAHISILTFRESRGWEVRYPFFTGQFPGATLTDERQLDRPIDNISGATLSVRAVTRVVRLALYLAGQLEP